MDVRRPFETTWEDWVLGGGLRNAFPDPEAPLAVEIGPGEDDFLLEQARARPDWNWLGVEYSSKRVHRYARRVAALAPDATNLRLAWRPAADVVGPFLTPGLVEAYHVNFPDPWPKKHHARYRLFTPEFAASLAASLAAGGTVRLATDVVEYAAEIHAAFSSVPSLSSRHPGPGWVRLPPGDRTTPFEERWRQAGRDIHYLDYEKAARPDARAAS
jgi:tRNA (guanine-N7-)-methyltransferase